MATIKDLQDAMANGLRKKCINTLLNDFSRITKEDAEDLTQIALAEACVTIDKVHDIDAVVINKAKLRAIDLRTIEIRRRDLTPIHRVYTPRRRDPYRAIDFRIDLERAIKRATSGTLQRNAAWLYFFEGYSVREIASKLPGRTQRGWEHVLNEFVLPSVRKRMRRGGYRI
jgi:DNA-directed RNA polymerase specialized sigma24 family protein